MTKDLEELRMDSTHLKKYISEHLRLLHSDENPMRTTLGKTSDLYLPYDNYYRVGYETPKIDLKYNLIAVVEN